MARTGYPRWFRGLGTYGPRGDGLCRDRRCPPDHGVIHNRPTSSCVCSAGYLSPAGGWSGHRDWLDLCADRRRCRRTRNDGFQHTHTSSLAILIGAFFLLFGALRMGWIAAFIPTPVMQGFIEGLVCVTIIGQVPNLLGIDSTSGNFFTKLWFVLQHLSEASMAPVLTGLLRHRGISRHSAPSRCRDLSWTANLSCRR